MDMTLNQTSLSVDDYFVDREKTPKLEDRTYDFESLGAGIMLGARKLVLKCRGSSGPAAIRSAAKILINVIEDKTFYE